MAREPGAASLSSYFTKLATSLEASAIACPAPQTAEGSEDGISLLGEKNELFVSYLQHLSFLMLLTIRRQSQRLGFKGAETDHTDEDMDAQLQDVVKKLVELRVYLEKGVRPLEGRLKYQLDKVVGAAESAERTTQGSAARTNGVKKQHQKSSRRAYDEGNESTGASDNSGLEDDDGDTSDTSASSRPQIDDLAYRPNLAAFASTNGRQTDRKDKLPGSGLASYKVTNGARPTDEVADTTDKQQPYRPPRMNPTIMPTTDGPLSARSNARRAPRSRAIDEYINSEMSQTPLAEPSIGSTIISGGRRTKSAREAQDDAERREYEEANFVRLPGPTKKDKRKQRERDGDGGRSQWGGEELRGLGEGLDRLDRVLGNSSNGAGAKRKGRLERHTTDGPRSDGYSSNSRAPAGKRRKTGSARR